MKKRSSKIIFASLGALTSISAISVGLVSCGKNTTTPPDKAISSSTLTPEIKLPISDLTPATYNNLTPATPTSSAIVTVLENQLSKLNTFSDVAIQVDAILPNNVVIGRISYNLYEKHIIATHYEILNQEFQVSLQWNGSEWVNSNLNNLINYEGVLGIKLAGIDYASYHGVIPSFNNNDRSLRYKYDNPDHIANWVNPDQKGLTHDQQNKIKKANRSLVTVSVDNNALIISYRAFAITTSATDKATRKAYNFTFSKKWDLTDNWGYEEHGSIKNISATLTEATKQYLAISKTKKLDGINLSANKDGKSWSVIEDSKNIGTITFNSDTKKTSWSFLAKN